jgi:SpoIID/LytB domain protein
LQAQAIAARSYAAREAMGRAGQPFDVYASTRSQAYPGAAALDSALGVVRAREHARTDAAVAETAGVHVTVAAKPVLTQFGASNGGATAASPLAHMVAAADPWDARSLRNPRLSWERAIDSTALGAKFGIGTVQAVQVLDREGFGPWGGRVTGVRLVGAAGAKIVTGDSAIRAGLGVSSSMFTFG